MVLGWCHTFAMALKVRGATIDWDSGGAPKAPPLIWGHGLTSSRADEDRDPIVDLHRVREHATVVRYDARGHGRSSPLAEPERGSWAELAKDQIELIDYLGIGEVILGGASMGTGTALHAALELGDRVQGLLLVIPPTGWEERAAQVSVYEQMASVVEAKGVEPIIAASASLAPPDPFVGSDEYRARRAAAMRSTTPERLAANFRGAGYADLPGLDQLATLAMPALVLAWTGDTGHPVSTAEQLGSTLPNAEVAIHSTADELATWTQRAIDFLTSLVA